MKVKREIVVAVCDFCDADATAVCPICGKDVCRTHDFTLIRSYRAPGEGFNSSWPQVTEIVRHFCQDHLTDELTKRLMQSSDKTGDKDE